MTDSKVSGSFVATIDLNLADKLLNELKLREFEISKPPYTLFSGKSKGINCTLYESGKLVIQGKESADFIEFYIEPEIVKTFTFRHPLANIDLSPRIGIDESGKGDFFGPLCVAGVYVGAEQFSLLSSLGVKDSKSLSDPAIRKIALEIKKNFAHHIVKINPLKYNQIYQDFKNLNRLLAWGHATTIEQLVEKTGCTKVIVDQFADEKVVELALARKKIEVELTQRHRAEEDLVVAAASILARFTFIDSLDSLSRELDIAIPKGSSKKTIEIGLKILEKWGEEKLRSICKEHFKTLDLILGKKRN